jgi:hypothetical protein
MLVEFPTISRTLSGDTEHTLAFLAGHFDVQPPRNMSYPKIRMDREL